MRVVRRFPLRILLASAVLFLLPLWAVSAKTNNSKFTGVYESEQANPEKPGPSMTLSLGRDGTVTFTQDYGKGPQTSFGHWVDTGSQVQVTFDAVSGQPPEAPMVFASSHDGLQAVTWDRAAWGKVNPPVMKKKSSDWHKKDHHRIL